MVGPGRAGACGRRCGGRIRCISKASQPVLRHRHPIVRCSRPLSALFGRHPGWRPAQPGMAPAPPAASSGAVAPPPRAQKAVRLRGLERCARERPRGVRNRYNNPENKDRTQTQRTSCHAAGWPAPLCVEAGLGGRASRSGRAGAAGAQRAAGQTQMVTGMVRFGGASMSVGGARLPAATGKRKRPRHPATGSDSVRTTAGRRPCHPNTHSRERSRRGAAVPKRGSGRRGGGATRDGEIACGTGGAGMGGGCGWEGAAGRRPATFSIPRAGPPGRL
jgi:hypothetical protein